MTKGGCAGKTAGSAEVGGSTESGLLRPAGKARRRSPRRATESWLTAKCGWTAVASLAIKAGGAAETALLRGKGLRGMRAARANRSRRILSGTCAAIRHTGRIRWAGRCGLDSRKRVVRRRLHAISAARRWLGSLAGRCRLLCSG